MKQQWLVYGAKFLQLSVREQYLIIATGLVAIIFCLFSFVIEPKLIQNEKYQKQLQSVKSSERSLNISIAELEKALKGDPNKALRKQVSQYEAKLAKVDKALLTLTTELIDPIQMRRALLELLRLQPGVSLSSFELVGAEEVLTATSEKTEAKVNTETASAENSAAEQGLSLYRHGINIKLTGGYFQLRDYLKQLEKLSWKFFWQGFHYQVKEYPNSELEIEIYSLSTNKEFIGV